MTLFNELKRRNVFRVAIAYVVIGWLIMQVGDTLGPALLLPGWINSALAFFLILGFPLALFFAWAFEMTPDGIKKEAQVDRSTSITNQTGKKLDRTIIGVLGAAVLFLLVDKFMLDSKSPEATITEKSVAVLPFIAMSRGPDDEYFADGLTEDLITLLSRIPGLFVIARNSSFVYKGKTFSIHEVAQDLGVRYVIEGSVRRFGAQLDAV